MKHTKRRLVLIMLVSMAVAFLVIALAFRFLIQSHVRGRASSSIWLYMTLGEDSAQDIAEISENYGGDSTMVVYSFVDENDPPKKQKEENAWEEFWNSIFSDDEWNSEEAFRPYYADAISSWWKEHPTEAWSVTKATIETETFYVSWKEGAHDERRFYYVNVTSEEDLIRTVSVVLYVIMALCLGGACLVGFFTGKKIETDQKRQKEFFENASHELKTPLMSIQGYAEGLHDGVITDQKAATGIILQETDKMTALVNDILSISRLESGAYQLHKEMLDVQDLISECLTSMETTIRDRQLRVSLECDAAPLEADRVQFEKAVRNILSNAIRYAANEIRIHYDGKQLVIWDDGTPISEESLKHLFDRFYTGQNGNTGIGMSLTKEICEQHGWKIKAENTPKGVQFRISF